jgi:hypothetical protein
MIIFHFGWVFQSVHFAFTRGVGLMLVSLLRNSS